MSSVTPGMGDGSVMGNRSPPTYRPSRLGTMSSGDDQGLHWEETASSA